MTIFPSIESIYTANHHCTRHFPFSSKGKNVPSRNLLHDFMAHAPRLKLGLEFPASVNPNRSGYIYTYAWFKPGGKCMRNHVAANVIISEIQWTRSRIHYACSPVYSCGKWRKRCANERQRLMYLNHSLKKGGEGRGIPSDINVVINERSVRKCKKTREKNSKDGSVFIEATFLLFFFASSKM